MFTGLSNCLTASLLTTSDMLNLLQNKIGEILQHHKPSKRDGDFGFNNWSSTGAEKFMTLFI